MIFGSVSSRGVSGVFLAPAILVQVGLQRTQCACKCMVGQPEIRRPGGLGGAWLIGRLGAPLSSSGTFNCSLGWAGWVYPAAT